MLSLPLAGTFVIHDLFSMWEKLICLAGLPSWISLNGSINDF
ncbi:hypothetical protein M106_3630 [Bacteroides fragilis str. 1009-4-F |nr:hypothetical protein M069_3948 [Bacteroides fragilis str. B1 (UDC16-1)]EYA28741.1 hypothetical protein M106_3630 [Bacteroides fragilis str. 1009-4-F \